MSFEGSSQHFLLLLLQVVHVGPLSNTYFRESLPEHITILTCHLTTALTDHRHLQGGSAADRALALASTKAPVSRQRSQRRGLSWGQGDEENASPREAPLAVQNAWACTPFATPFAAASATAADERGMPSLVFCHKCCCSIHVVFYLEAISIA